MMMHGRCHCQRVLLERFTDYHASRFLFGLRTWPRWASFPFSDTATSLQLWNFLLVQLNLFFFLILYFSILVCTVNTLGRDTSASVGFRMVSPLRGVLPITHLDKSTIIMFAIFVPFDHIYAKWFNYRTTLHYIWDRPPSCIIKFLLGNDKYCWMSLYVYMNAFVLDKPSV